MPIKKYESSGTMNHYYTIGEISRLYHIGTDSIRYYERMGILEPVRGKNGYRYYSSQSIWRMNIIINLRGLGFSVSRIRDYFQNRTVDSTKALLEEELELIQQKTDELNRLRRSVQDQLAALEEVDSIQCGRVRTQHFPDRRAFQIKQAYSQDEDMDLLMKRLVEQSNGSIEMIGNNRMASIIAQEKASHLFEGAIIFDPKGDIVVPEGDYLSVFYCGPTASQQNLEILRRYAMAHNLTIHPPFLDLVWRDIHTATDPAEFISEVQARITK